MDRQSFKEKVYAHLNDTKSYTKINQKSPLTDTRTLIISFLETIYQHQHIDRYIFNFMKPPLNPRLGIFYILPKIHKETIPGRPIASSVNSITEFISEFLTICLQFITEKLQSHINNTKHFLQKIMKQPKVKPNTIFITINVKSLYTNIPHRERINACLHYVEKYRHILPKYIPNKTILNTLLLFVLENNFFEFDNQIYKQIFGTAMGTKMAPPYANLFMGILEEENILNSKFNQYLKLYLRFLDDIFIIWNRRFRRSCSHYGFLCAVGQVGLWTRVFTVGKH